MLNLASMTMGKTQIIIYYYHWVVPNNLNNLLCLLYVAMNVSESSLLLNPTQEQNFYFMQGVKVC